MLSADADGTCRELVELVTAYLEGALSAEEREGFERHLADCTGCRHYLLQMRVTIDVAGALPDPAPEPVRAALLAAFRAARGVALHGGGGP